MKEGRGEIEVGYIFVTLPISKSIPFSFKEWIAYALKFGLMTNEHAPIVPTLMMSDNGVNTCNLNAIGEMTHDIVLQKRYLVSCNASRTAGSRVSTGRPFITDSYVIIRT